MNKDDALEKLVAFASSSSVEATARTAADLVQLKLGKMANRIHSDGHWSFRGSPFERPEMVALLAQSLVFFKGDYYLIAPEQLLKITVDDVPFLITHIDQSADKKTLVVTSNLGEQVTVGEQHPLCMTCLPNQSLEIPVVEIRAGLAARFSRACFYELIECCEPVQINGRNVMQLYSNSVAFSVGMID
jgi:hypothetical protein